MDELEKYYQYLKSKGANIPPSVDVFRVNLQDPVKAEKYYQYLVNNKFNVAPTYESFTTTLGLKKKEQEQPQIQSEEVGGSVSVPLSQSKSSSPSQYTGTVDFNKLNALQGGSQAATPQQEELAQYGTETVKATKEKQEKDITDAATNTAKLYFENNPSLLKSYNLSTKKATGDKFSLTQLKNATPFQQKVADLTNDIKNGKLITYTANTGEKRVARPMGDWDNFKSGVSEAWNANKKVDEYLNKSDADKIKFLKEFTPDTEILPIKSDTQSGLYQVGAAVPTTGKMVAAGVTGAALSAAIPETGGISTAGLPALLAWASVVPDMAKQNQMSAEIEAFHQVKKDNPNISDEEALKLAKKAGVVGYATGLAKGTAMNFIGQGSLPANTGQGLLKATWQFLKNQPESIAEVSGLSISTSLVEKGLKKRIGVDEDFAEKAGEVLNADAIGQLAFNVGFGVIGAPKYVKAQANEVLSKMDTEALQMMQQRAVDEGLLNEQQINEANKSLQDYKAAKSKMPPLDSEEKTAVIAGLIQKKQNLERLKLENDKSFHDEIDAQIEATDQRIQLAKKSNDPIKYAEQDDLDGQKNFTPKPFESLSKKEVEGIAEEVPKEYGEAEAIEVGGDAEGSAKKYKAEATVTRQQGFIKIKDKIPVDDKVYNDKVDAEAAAQKALAEHYYNNAMDETLKPENKSSVTVIRPEENKAPEIVKGEQPVSSIENEKKLYKQEKVRVEDIVERTDNGEMKGSNIHVGDKDLVQYFIDNDVSGREASVIKNDIDRLIEPLKRITDKIDPQELKMVTENTEDINSVMEGFEDAKNLAFLRNKDVVDAVNSRAKELLEFYSDKNNLKDNQLDTEKTFKIKKELLEKFLNGGLNYLDFSKLGVETKKEYTPKKISNETKAKTKEPIQQTMEGGSNTDPLSNPFKEGTKSYDAVESYLKSPAKVGADNLLSYISKHGQDGSITRFRSGWVNDIYESFKDSPDADIRNSVEHLKAINDKIEESIKEARETIDTKGLFSEEGKKANELLFNAISGLKTVGRREVVPIDNVRKLMEELGHKVFDKIKEKYNWTKDIQNGYDAYLSGQRKVANMTEEQKQFIINEAKKKTKEPVISTMEGGRASDELIPAEKSSDTESVIPETTRTTATEQATFEQSKIDKDAIPIRSAEEIPLGEAPGDSQKMGARVPKSEEPTGTQTSEASGGEIPPSQERKGVTVQYPATRLSYKGTQELANEFGIPEREATVVKHDLETIREADELLNKGWNANDAINKINESGGISDASYINLTRYAAKLSDDLRGMNPKSAEFEKTLTELNRVAKASDLAGKQQGRDLGIRGRFKTLADDSLAEFWVRELEANKDAPLTEKQKENAQKEWDNLQDKKEKDKKITNKIFEKKSQLAAEKEFNKTKKSTPKTKKTHDDFVTERKSLKDQLAEAKAKHEQWLKDNNISMQGASPFTLTTDMAKVIGKIVKSHIEEGVQTLSDVTKKVYDEIKDLLPDITEKHIHDVIAGEYNEKKQTRSEVAKIAFDLKTEAELINKLDKLLKEGVPKSEKKKIKRNQQIEELSKKIKDFKKENPNPENQLETLKERNKKATDKIQEKIKKGDFEPDKKRTPLLEDAELKNKFPELYKQAKASKDELIKAKQEIEFRRLKQMYDNRSDNQKFADQALRYLNVPRTLMASMDFSAPLRQALLATVAHPTTAFKLKIENGKLKGEGAFWKMFQHAASQKAFDRWFHDIRENPMFEVAEKSKLYLSDPHDFKLTAREEAFLGNIAEKIPLAGRLVKGSERAYVSYLNKMRWDLFNQYADVLIVQGKTVENSPELYKTVASFVNNATGRGGVGAKAEPTMNALNAIFFSPRLIASRVNLLTNWANPKMWKGENRQVLKWYAQDMAKLIGVGISTLALFKYGFGAEVEADPRSSDFGKIKFGNTRWDIWGGLQPYVRVVAQVSSGKTKSATTDEIKELDAKEAFGRNEGTIIGTFARGKLAPIPGIIWDILSRRTIIGEKVNRELDNPLTSKDDPNEGITLTDEIIRHVFPLIVRDIKEAYKEGGIGLAIGTAIPSTFGVGVNTYEPRQPKSKKHKAISNN